MTPFATIVRQALDELDDRPDLDHWRVYDADKLAKAIVVHMTANRLAMRFDFDEDIFIAADDWDDTNRAAGHEHWG